MKRKVVIALLCGILAISSMTACGGAKETVAEAATTAETTEESEEDAKAAEEAAAKEAEEKAAEEAAAKEAEKEEAYETGRACLYGLDGQEIDLETAYNSFEKALELGKTEANFYLGVMYDWKSYPEQDYEKARAYYEAAGENPYAYVALGFNYYYGQVVEADQEKGKEYFDNAIALGCMDGYLGLGLIASNEGDDAAAEEDYSIVAEQGTEPLYVMQAANKLGSMCEYQDDAKAMEWHQKAYELGSASSAYSIALMYQGGRGVEQDTAKAEEWYQNAYELDNIMAVQIAIGYEMEQDYAKALAWYEKAYEAGCNYADVIGNYYYMGQGTEQDYAKALEWYEKAYDDNNELLKTVDDGDWLAGIYQEKATQLANNIANMYENGLGVDQDAEKAAEWYAKAEEAAEN